MILNTDNSHTLESIINEALNLPFNKGVDFINNALKPNHAEEISNNIEIPDNDFITTKNPVKKIILMMVKYASDKYKVRYRKYRDVSDEVNTLYDKVNYILKNDVRARQAHANDVIAVKYQDLLIYQKSTKKYYNFEYFPIQIPVDQMSYLIRSTIKKVGPEDPDNMKIQLESVKNTCIDYIHKNYWYLTQTEVVSVSTKEFKTTLEDHIMHVKSSVDSRYAILVSENRLMSETNYYFLATNKFYDELTREFGDNKMIMDVIDDIFKEILKYNQIGLEYNFKGSNIALDQLKTLENQLETFYDIIKK